MAKKRFVLANMLVFLLVIVLTVGCVEDNETNNEQNSGSSVVLSVIFGDYQVNYTLEDIEALDSYNDTATMIKVGWLPDVVTEGPNEFTGVKISTILDEIENLPENYSIKAYSSDGETTDYTKDNITGNVDIYNASGTIIGNNGSTMILAYKINGEYFEEDTGPIRIVFCNENYTASNLWAKMVVSIEIISVQ